MIDLRLRSVISDRELDQKVGKIVTDEDYNALLTGPCRVSKPDGSLLCVYLPGALSTVLQNKPVIYPILHSLRSMQTDNRGHASGTERMRYGDEKRTRTKRVRSCILGAFDPGGPKQFCRLTGWTGSNLPRWDELRPLFHEIDVCFQQHAPIRHTLQMEQVKRTDPAWVIPGTAFTTITVNNTYPTGVHTDSGDLETGFSTLAVLRRGHYTGGVFVLPKFRVGVDMQHGDLLLLDAHEHHGNTAIIPGGGGELVEDAERISVVSYFRTGMVNCGTADEELRKAEAFAARRGGTDGAGESATGTGDSDEGGAG